MIEVMVAVLLFPLLRDPGRSWLWTRGWVETLANSWREWRTDGIRVISHVVFATCSGGAGFAIIAMAVPPDRFTAVVWVTLCALLGACLWAQVLEGSSILLRPFGWYGGVLGAVVGVATASGDAKHAIALLSALAVAAPWIQAIGRLRCLVQGCCHGGPAPDWLGIRYFTAARVSATSSGLPASRFTRHHSTRSQATSLSASSCFVCVCLALPTQWSSACT